MQFAPTLISSPTLNQPGYNAPPVYQLPPVQQNVQIIERIVEKPVEKIVYVDRYIQSPPPPASHYPSPPPSYMSPVYNEAPVLLQQDSQVRIPEGAGMCLHASSACTSLVICGNL
jgi:hypothetical protein